MGVDSAQHSGVSFRVAEGGFSTAEIIVVISLMTILATIAVPRMTARYAAIELRGAARHVAMDIQRTRARAVAENARYRMRFGGDRYTLEKEVDGTFEVFDAVPFRRHVSATLAEGNEITFRPSGWAEAMSDVRVNVAYAGGGTKLVTLRFGGRVTIDEAS